MYLYALLLLIAPWEPTPVESPQLIDALRAVCVDHELLDPDDHFWFAPPNFCDHLRYQRGYWRELADAPRIADALRLPPGAKESYQFNCAYRLHLDLRISYDTRRGDVLREARGRAVDLAEIWDRIHTATGSYCIVTRRRALMELRALMGAEDYYSGRWPCCVPAWAFTEVGR